MKIAFINQPWNSIVPPVQAGSIAILTYEVAHRLAHDCEVTIYARRHGREQSVQWHEGVQYRRFPTSLDRRLNKVVRPFVSASNAKRPFFARGAFFPTYIWQIAMHLRRHPCDIVHIHNMSQCVSVIRALNPHTKIVLHMHCEWLTQLDREMIARRLSRTDFVIACSDYITQGISGYFPEMTGRCATVHNGVSLEEFTPSGKNDKVPGSRKLLFVGRLSPEKGIHVLLEAMPLVIERHPEAQLELVGPLGSAPMDFIVGLSDDPMVKKLEAFYDGNYKDHLERRLTETTRQKVSFTGKLDHSQLVGRLGEAAMFLHPSVWGEPFPLAVLEAMAAGVPVVASRIGGLVESVEHEKTGLLVEPNNPRALAEAINKILDDDALRRRMSEESRHRAVAMFSWDRVARDLLAIYRTL